MRRAPDDEAALSVFDRTSGTLGAGTLPAIRVADAMRRVDLSWAEAVAIVQAVCRQLEPGRTPPAVGDLRVCAGGLVTFPPGGMVDEDVACLSPSTGMGGLYFLRGSAWRSGGSISPGRTAGGRSSPAV